MSFWTYFGLIRGQGTTKWPKKGDNDGQTGVLGMPDFNAAKCDSGCNICAEVCLPKAITLSEDQKSLDIDYGKCVNCQMCVDHCPTDAMTASQQWAYGVRERNDLIIGLWTYSQAVN